jgi:hypothetical protein
MVGFLGLAPIGKACRREWLAEVSHKERQVPNVTAKTSAAPHAISESNPKSKIIACLYPGTPARAPRSSVSDPRGFLPWGRATSVLN